MEVKRKVMREENTRARVLIKTEHSVLKRDNRAQLLETPEGSYQRQLDVFNRDNIAHILEMAKRNY